MTPIDPELIYISDDEYTGILSSPEGKYVELFSRLRSGQCIRCEPSEIHPIRYALVKWLKNTDQLESFDVRAIARYYKDGRGGVWLLAKEQKLKRAA